MVVFWRNSTRVHCVYNPCSRSIADYTIFIFFNFRVVNRKPRVVFFGRFCRFSRPKTDFLKSVFRLCSKQPKSNYQLGIFRSVSLCSQTSKKRPKPTEFFDQKPKNRPSHFIFVLFSVHNPVATWYQHMHTESFEMLSYTWFHSETDPETDR